jgi:hypothetical protein
MSKIISTDGFLWLDVTEKAKEIYTSGLFSIYSLHHDGSESLIEGYDDLNKALAQGNNIGIELGHLNEIEKRRKFEVEVNPFLKTIIVSSTFNDNLYTQILRYTDLDEWVAFKMAWKRFDLHILYEDSLNVSIYPIEDDITQYSNNCIVNLKTTI